MPLNLEYVLSTYGIWLFTMILYVVIVRRKLKVYEHALENLETKKKL
ncbi:MAG: hypothetical protein HQM13_13945 [SAR324 cluster bacterium]|nr:hypothetical protein [SAR324 cluster bacterium]